MKNLKNCFFQSIGTIMVLMLFFNSFHSGWCQVQEKKDLTPENYHLWHKLQEPQISDDGVWISYLLSYESGMDTLMLQQRTGKERFFFSGGSAYNFAGNKWFIYKIDNKLKIFDLKDYTMREYPNALEYKIVHNNKTIVFLSGKNHEKNKELKKLNIMDLASGKTFSTDNVIEFSFNSHENLLAFSRKDRNNWTLNILDINHPENSFSEIYKCKNILEKIVWGKQRNLALFENNSTGAGRKVIWFSDIQKNPPNIFDVENRNDFEENYIILNNPGTVLRFSEDNEKLFFYMQKVLKKKNKNKAETSVQIWNAKDKLIFPAYDGIENFFINPPIVFCWKAKENKIMQIGNNLSSRAIFPLTGNYVFTHSILDDIVSYDDKRSDLPIYGYDLKEGKEDFIMWRKPFMPIKVSPNGKYLAYFDEKDWWIFDVKDKTHKNITKNIESSFEDRHYDWSGKIPPAGLAGFSEDDESVLLYDTFDIWKIPLKEGRIQRLTNGKEAKKIYRTVQPVKNKEYSDLYLSTSISLTEDLFFSVVGEDGKMEYVLQNPSGTKETIISENGKIDWITKAENTKSFIYTVEHFHMAPKLIYSDENITTELFASNQQQSKYKWGHSELIHFKVSRATSKAALFYPAGYNPKNQYPMIVFIYEKMSNRINQYENPSLLTGADINITNWTSRGYFVLCPDIVYSFNNVGHSALQSVKSAIEKVLAVASIDENKIGLFGHSFGGYETSFIIGNTNIFAAAISASGVQDLRSFYLSNAWLWSMSQAGRFLNSQDRFNVQYFENPTVYEKNSPINYAPLINTPLLTITGGKDTNVNWEQSVLMYNALRLLNKEHIMLIYPDEGHDVQSKENQIDLTYKRWQWMDHYLKEREKENWMFPTL